MSTYQSRLTYGNGLWVLVNGLADYPMYSGEILFSADLVNWTFAYTNSQSLSAVTFAADRFVAAGYNGAFLVSPNGTNWANPFSNAADLYFSELDFLNGQFVGIGWDRFFFSSNGVAWTTSPMPTTTGRLFNLTFGNGLYVAGGEYRSVWISTNGTEWNNPITNLSRFPYSGDTRVAFGNGVFVAVSYHEADILTSADGTNWMLQTLVTNIGDYVHFSDVTFANGRFVAVASTAIASSLDGTNWNIVRTNLGLHSVAGGAGRFVAVGGNGPVSSSDGTNWVASPGHELDNFSYVAFGAGWFVATSGAAYSTSTLIAPPRPYWISSDGINWTRRTVATPQAMGPLAFGDGTFIAGTERGGLLQTDPLITLSLRAAALPELQISGPRHRQYQIECRDTVTVTDGWASLGTVTVTNDSTVFTDLSATNAPRRFYRAVLLNDAD